MAAQASRPPLGFGTGPESREDRRFYGVVIASLLLHVAVFAVLVVFERYRGSDPPRLIMADMVTVPPPLQAREETAPPPEPARPIPVVKAPVRVSTPVISRQMPAPLAPATQPVPMAPLGDAADSGKPSPRGEMAVPTAPPAAHRSVDATPATPAVAQTAAPPAKPADHVEKLAKARASYRAMIAALIDRNKEYPVFARKAGQQGTCSVRCTMMCDGTVKRVELVKSSGYDALDKAGLRAVNSIGKFPPPPTDGQCTEVSFEVPITFRLT